MSFPLEKTVLISSILLIFTLSMIFWISTDLRISYKIVSSSTSSPDISDKSLLYLLVGNNTDTAEQQYYKQREYEIKRKDPFESFSANYPCFWSESFINADLDDNQNDGGKWGCGLSFIQKQCIVYSFGSHNNFRFEFGVNELTQNKCDIYIFDPFHYPSDEFIKNLSHSNIYFYKWGISDHNSKKRNMYRLDTIMSLLNHTFIDILKIDVEGYEYPAFYSLHKKGKWPSIGQILVEVHIGAKQMRQLWNRSFGVDDAYISPKHMVGTLIQLFETYDFRIFHAEINMYHRTCIEYALIQKDWRPHIKHYNTSTRMYQYDGPL